MGIDVPKFIMIFSGLEKRKGRLEKLLFKCTMYIQLAIRNPNNVYDLSIPLTQNHVGTHTQNTLYNLIQLLQKNQL